MKKRIVWGTCFYNETSDEIIHFFKKSIKSLEKNNFIVTPIVFYAKYNHNDDDIKHIKDRIKNIKIITNKLNVFPNKNYGITLITNMAYELNNDYVAIIDPDWNIKNYDEFVTNIMNDFISLNGDILIPNIGNASGRSNILIGRTAVKLFYKEYLDILQSPFPGAVIAKTIKLYQIVNDNYYHFDWGGEWDIISIGIHKKMKLITSKVDIIGIRHRTNSSKMHDSFQIWTSILGNEDLIYRFNNMNDYQLNVSNNRIYKQVSKANNIINIINIILSNNPSKTEKQILYMILYPVAYILGDLKEIPVITDEFNIPYDKNELYEIADFAAYCLKKALQNRDIKKINRDIKNITGKYFSMWDNHLKTIALKEYGEE